ncbi:pro-sigmaK processing inhibitor BofA family protein [Alkalihalobacterium chitinilyticum]|uniref:Pro-sigmaK processing inhibitor BofA family protein n=1 Tax=Alkalihalobacterium chitinilyticum TaxID=2980103 RepID=A0ABT5VLK6_9BACI|nr:pro-sigmaK processing inhibitor BofA family protein [Alkalihalobacterium chitinilyticum]MDE5416318.1 pro-sigmaK processing inhibitor BofA family protein [Alkalihalobacterium chitinilyticum]
MDPILIVALIGGLIFLLLIVGAPIKPLRFAGQAAVKLMIGALFLFFLNAFGSLIDYHIPINIITASVSGLLGIPGVLLLVAIEQFVL